MNPNNSLTTFLFVALVASGTFLLGRSCTRTDSPEHTDHVVASETKPTAPEIWTCSMHPQIRLPEPGDCPICGMDLILAEAGDDSGALAELKLSPGAMQRAQIRTARVERIGLVHELPLVGKVVLDETRVATISSWVAGRLDRLFVDYTGTRVRAGDHLAEIYSPTLYSAQEELLQAIRAAERVADSDLDMLRTSTERTVFSARERLRLFGLDSAQIDALVARGKPEERMTLRAPIGGIVVHKAALEGMFVKEGTQIVKIADLARVWVVLDAYESDLAWLRYGQAVQFSTEAYPGEVFEARVDFIDPVLDPRTRTVNVRLSVDNADRRLKPDMFVKARVQAQLSDRGQVVDATLEGHWMCPMHPEVTGVEPGTCSVCGMDLVPVGELGFVPGGATQSPLAVPDTAPLFTGQRSIVYVQLPDREEPTFEGREVLLGPHAGDWYVVLDGLVEGEEVVVQGNFKIDSELQIRAKPSMMSPAAEGGSSRPVEPSAARKTEPLAGVPAGFRSQLSGFLRSYLALGQELADDRASEGARRNLAAGLEAIDMQPLEGAAHMAWMEALPTLRSAVERIVRAEDVEAARAGFGDLSGPMVLAVEEFGLDTGQAPGAEAEATLAIFHCPMAFDGVGADWIAPDGPTANPYFGSSMLRCGDVTRLLQPPVEPPTPKEPQSMSTPAAFQTQLGELVLAYTSLTGSLYADAENPALRKRVVEAFEALDMQLLTGAAHMDWMSLAPALGQAIEGLQQASDLEAVRVALAPLTMALVAAVERFGLPAPEEGHGPLALFHCPMAFDFEGADWLGETGPVENPYFGSEMPHCGSLVRELELQGER